MTDDYEEFMKVANEYYDKYVPEIPKEMRFKDFPLFETRSGKDGTIHTRVGFYGFTQCFLSDYHPDADECFKELTGLVKDYMKGWMTEPTKTVLNNRFRVYAHNMRMKMSKHDMWEPCPFCGSFELEERDLEVICCGCGLHIGLPFFIDREEGRRCLRI